MSEFWYTSQTMRAIKGETFRSFELFSPTHLIWIALVILSSIWVFTIYKKFDDTKKRKVYVILTVLMLADELLKYIITLATNQFLWQFLPLHLCSINLFVCLWHTIKPNPLCKEILYALCIPGAIIAFVSPAWQPLPLWNFMHLHSGTVHLFLLLYSLLILADGYRPQIRNLPKVLLFLGVVAVFAYGINKVLDTNFLFLMRTDNNPLLLLVSNIFGKFYIIGLGVLISLICLLVYLPWVFIRKK